MLHRNDESRRPRLFPDTRGKTFRLSPFKYVSCRLFVTVPFIKSRKYTCIATLLRFFFCELDFVKCLSWVYKSNSMLFLFLSVTLVNYSDWFLHVKPALNSWHKLHLVVIFHPFHILLDLIANILLRIFVSLSVSDIGLWFSFFVLLSLSDILILT